MLDKVIYFPYIRVPQNEWFTRVLLYWDQVGTIMPHEYADDPIRLGNYMAELIDNQLLKAVTPDRYISRIPNFSQAFLDLIDESQVIQDRRVVALERGETVRIHMEKILPLSHDLIDRGLAKESTWDWYDVERITANYFMAYLSSVLGKLDNFQMTPITDQDIFTSVFLSSGPIHPTEALVSELQTSVLEKALPAPVEGIPVRELVSFKERHSELLVDFRKYLEESITEIASEDDEYLRKRRLLHLQDDMQREIDKIKDEMKKKNWGQIVIGGLKGFSIGTTLGALLSTGNPIALLARVPGLIVSIYSAFNGSPNHQKKILELPCAYAAFAQEQFGMHIM